MEPSEAIKFLQCERDFAEDDSVGGIKRLMCETAIEACKKQVPMKPNKYKTLKAEKIGRVVFNVGTEVEHCPLCNRILAFSPNYCPDCGQKILRK